MHWIYWAPLGSATLHIIEEFVFPGGFMTWYRRSRPAVQASITPRFLVVVNILLIILCYDAGAMAGRPLGTQLWFLVMAILFANGIWHLVGTIKTRSYSPGLVTGLALYVPVGILGAVQLIRSGQASIAGALPAAALGASYQLWSNHLHRRRAKHMSEKSS
ncbi:MAG TPA: HXXEE domain-containing protein [bacterium]|nr:HXXEE domain-containing protein [bacterium]